MIRKAIVAVAAVLLAGLVSFTATQVAGAQYGPEACTVAVTPTSVDAGATVTLSGSLTSSLGPVTPQSVTFSIDGLQIGETTTVADGSFSVQVTIPLDLAPGSYTIVADCGAGTNGAIMPGTQIRVLPEPGPNTPGSNSPGSNSPGSNAAGSNTPDANGGVGAGSGGVGSSGSGSGSTGSGGLARTGTDLGLPVQIGVALLALGGVITALSTSRRRRNAVA